VVRREGCTEAAEEVNDIDEQEEAGKQEEGDGKDSVADEKGMTEDVDEIDPNEKFKKDEEEEEDDDEEKSKLVEGSNGASLTWNGCGCFGEEEAERDAELDSAPFNCLRCRFQRLCLLSLPLLLSIQSSKCGANLLITTSVWHRSQSARCS